MGIPNVLITSTEISPTGASPIPITITFSEPVSGFTLGDITLGNGTVGGFSGSGTTYTANITPTNDGSVIVDISAGVAVSSSTGDGNTPAPQFSIIYDTTGPSVSITSTESSSTGASPIPITITFSEPVTGFTLGDITLGNGTVGGFSGSGTTYTANITPTSDGSVTVDISAGVAIDVAGNGNTPAPQFSIIYDGNIVISGAVLNQTASAGDGDFIIRITLDDAGVSPHTISIDSGSYQSTTLVNAGNFEDFTGLGSGNHTFQIKDSNDVVGNLLSIDIYPLLTIRADAQLLPVSENSSDGQILLSALGGTGAYTYELFKNAVSVTGSPQFSPLFTGLNPGDYTGYVYDSIVTGLAANTPVFTLIIQGPDQSSSASWDISNTVNTDYRYNVNNVQVVGPQGAAIPDATNNNSLIYTLNNLLDRLRTHGLIDDQRF